MAKVKRLEQLAFWVFIYLFIFDYHLIDDNWSEAIRYTSLEVLSYMLVAYLNYHLLIPFLLQKKHYVLYALAVLLLPVVYIFSIRFSGLESILYEETAWRNIFSMILNTCLFVLFSFLYWYYQQWYLERERQLRLKNEKLASELKFLKAQVSPHFIFNTLNNIYTLVLQKHEHAGPMVAKLSKIMRYMIYDCSAEQVLLARELESLQHFIDLQLLRKPLSENVDLYLEGNVNSVKIAPLLLINFVENSFKHGNLDTEETGWIKIAVIVDEQKALHFTCKNSKSPNGKQTIEGGLGLRNAKRQLALNYPNQHEITIDEEPGSYTVDLKIQLEKSSK